ncbi:MAG: hypothetical protein Q9P01_06180 [Anaerolineae bacterium]|nr:hypothetical protein [Anaerolineae bacterium]
MLRIEPVSKTRQAVNVITTRYDYRYGETDLLEESVSKRANVYLILSFTLIVVIVLGGLGLFFTRDLLFSNDNEEELPASITTNTARPTLDVATVTIGPPTSTFTYTPAPTVTPSVTPTRGPCVQIIQQGSNLITAILNCGHRSQDVVPTVLAMNNLSDANTVRVGQEILIPWPTTTPDPNATPTSIATEAQGLDANSGEDAQDVLIADESILAFADTPIPTLPVGVQWHYVQPDENIISIAFQYSADVKTLSELNREIDFARCDFGETYGGPECLVQLFQGQAVRVPAPTPTPTLSPTYDPNSTATPTPTATVNIPSPYSPTDREFFYADDLVTLRWIASATLQQGEVYRVDVRDLTTGASYMALTSQLSFSLPLEWQGSASERHDFEWTIGIVNEDNPTSVRYQTTPRNFVWQGIQEGD